MVRALVLVWLATGCGRIGFADRAGAGAGADATPPDAAAAIGFSQLTAYADQTCALYRGKAYCWGSNASGQIGDGTTNDALVPTAVALPAGVVDALAQGQDHGCAIVDGTLACFGSLGSPAPIAVLLPSPATAVAAGRGFTCTIAGDTYCWGDNSNGQLGTGDTNPRAVPSRIDYAGPSAIVAIEAGDDHACSLDAAGVARCWGHDDDGALGTGAEIGSASSPVPVTAGIAVLPQIAGWHACALQGGRVWCWGQGTSGELGDGGSTSTATPQLVPGLTNVTAVAVGGGPTDADASCAIVGGTVKCWGNGFYGRLGQGAPDPSSVPIDVVGLPGPATEIAIGYDHACATLADGDAWCWGRGDTGQLGNGARATSYTAVRVTPPT